MGIGTNDTSFLLTQERLDGLTSGFKFFLGMGEEPGAASAREVRLKTLIN